MKVVYLGSGQFGIESLNALSESNHNLEFIVTAQTHPAGRGRKPKPTPIACWADSHSVPFIESDNVNTPQIIDKIAAHKPDLIVVIAFGQKIGNDLINLPSKGTINVHASLLPKYRGAAPINWAIINGESQTGISIFALAEKMDTGLICAKVTTDIGPDETASQLHDKLAHIAAPLLVETLDKIATGTVVHAKQDNSKATKAPKLKKSDGFLDFDEPAESLRRKILGFWPWPGGSTIYVSKKTGKCNRIILAGAEVAKNSNPAHLAVGILDENLNVICGQNALKITKIKPAGSSLMNFKDFVNGHETQPGDLFMTIDS